VSSPRVKVFIALNGLRFIAALAIVAYHYAPLIENYQNLPAIIRKLINECPAAVGFFFILSGFVLAHRYLGDESQIENIAGFYGSRFRRIYPAYMVGFVLFIPLAFVKYITHPPYGVLEGNTLVISAILYCLMLQAWTPLAQAWNGPSWSLSVEAFMYLVFPVLGARIARLSNRNTFFLLIAAWLLPVAIAGGYQAGLIPVSIWEGYLRNNPLFWTPLFVMGVAGARFIGPWQKVESALAGRISIGAVIGVVLLALVWSNRWSEAFVAGGIAPLLVAVVICFTRNLNWLTKIIGGNTFNRLGQASYVMYIIQAPIWHYWQAATNLLRQLTARTNTVAAWQFVAFVPILIFISLMTERFVETPGRRWLANIPKAPRSSQAVQSKARVASQGGVQ
jgi:peptidoglycan/LPS O-acetylase OafA/YrhL